MPVTGRRLNDFSISENWGQIPNGGKVDEIDNV
jgi:hypothetical protein